MFKVPEQHRITKQMDYYYGSTNLSGNNGAFKIRRKGQWLNIIASDGAGWEHVSVSRKDRCPTWEEMNFVKELFWSENDCVVQFHPPESEYVNQHPNCLHLWKSTEYEFVLPPSILVGEIN